MSAYTCDKRWQADEAETGRAESWGNAAAAGVPWLLGLMGAQPHPNISRNFPDTCWTLDWVPALLEQKPEQRGLWGPVLALPLIH